MRPILFAALFSCCLAAYAQTNPVESAPGDTTTVNEPPVRIYEPSPAPAQTNTAGERWRQIAASGRFGTPGRPKQLQLKNDPSGAAEGDWRRRASLGANLTRGNTDTSLYEAGLELGREKDGRRVKIDGQARYGESDGERNKQNGTASVRYERDLSDDRYWAFDLQASHDRLADLDYRLVWTLSHGWFLTRTEDNVVNAELGPGYVQEMKNDDREGYFVVRAGEAIDHRLNDHVVLWQCAEYLPNVQDWSQYLLNTEIGIESALTSSLRLRTFLQERYDSKPAEDKESSDFILSVSLVTEF